MSVLPGYHRRGCIPRLKGSDPNRKGFFANIDPHELPSEEEISRLKVDYKFEAGTCAVHHIMLPHTSSSNMGDMPRRACVSLILYSCCHPRLRDGKELRAALTRHTCTQLRASAWLPHSQLALLLCGGRLWAEQLHSPAHRAEHPSRVHLAVWRGHAQQGFWAGSELAQWRTAALHW